MKYDILGYYGQFFYVSYEKNEEIHEGFVYMGYFPSDVASGHIFRQISEDNIVVFCGETSSQTLTTNYNGQVTWFVANPTAISFNGTTGKIIGKAPGVSAIKATSGSKSLYCMVYSVGKWYETETAVITKSVKVQDIPLTEGETIATLSSGVQVTAKGDIGGGNGWLYASSGDVTGFIRISDFPGIDYLMTEYHYYDKGFGVRFGSSAAKIYDYASVLNDVMMGLFNLKINPYVEPYTSTADQCKMWSYGSVTPSNLFSDCPGTGNHYQNSCLPYQTMREAMVADKGEGTNTIGRCLWTGHILEPHTTSMTNIGLQAIVFTTGNFAGYDSDTNTYINYDSSRIRRNRLYEIVHETGHLLGTVDGYCFGQPEDGGHCSNSNCYECNEMTIPRCIMVQIYNPENENVVFCEECTQIITEHLKTHH